MRRIVRLRFRSRRVVVSAKLVAAVCGIVVFLAGVVLGGRSFLKIREVRCEMRDGGACDELLRAELQRLVGTPLYRVRGDVLEQRVLKALPQLSGVELALESSAVVRATAVSHLPMYVVESSGSARYVVSENGLLMREASTEDSAAFQPVFRLFLDPGQPGNPLPANLHQSISGAVAGFRKTSLTGERVDVVHPSQLELILPGNKRGIFEGTQAEGQLSALQQLLNTATIAEQGLQSIDVRFARPVLR